MRRGIFIYLTVLSALIASSCSHRHDGFVLEGTVVSGGNDSILVTGIDSRFDRVDTIRMSDGQFRYECLPDTVTPLLLMFYDGREDVVFADKQLSSTYFRDTADVRAHVEGGFYNEQYDMFMMNIDGCDSIAVIAGKIEKFIDENPDSEVTPYLIYHYFLQSRELDEKRVLAMTDRMSGQMQDVALISDIRTDFGKTKTKVSIMDDIALKDTALTTVKLSGIPERTNLVICLWASWNEESRKMEEEIRRIGREYKDRDFTFAGVSIDTNAERWKNAVVTDSLDWRQYIDMNGWNSTLIRSLNITQLPHYIILGPQRRIISVTDDLSRIERNIDSMDKYDAKKKKAGGQKTPTKADRGITVLKGTN